MNRLASAFLIGASLLTASAGAAAADAPAQSSSLTIGISGFVPVICHASLDAGIVAVQPGETELGQLNEYCNSPAGYQIFVDSSAELAGATLTVDGNEVALAADGPTMVASSAGPAFASRQIALSGAAPAGGHLSFRIVPL